MAACSVRQYGGGGGGGGGGVARPHHSRCPGLVRGSREGGALQLLT